MMTYQSFFYLRIYLLFYWFLSICLAYHTSSEAFLIHQTLIKCMQNVYTCNKEKYYRNHSSMNFSQNAEKISIANIIRFIILCLDTSITLEKWYMHFSGWVAKQKHNWVWAYLQYFCCICLSYPFYNQRNVLKFYWTLCKKTWTILKIN